jgi:hypothetical protein
LSWALRISTGAASPPPALAALAMADFDTAICSVGAGTLAQPARIAAAQAAAARDKWLRTAEFMVFSICWGMPDCPHEPNERLYAAEHGEGASAHRPDCRLTKNE